MKHLIPQIDNIVSLLESKNHLIDKLNLTDTQKEELKAFFKAHPNFENKIDWNRKDLTYADFTEVLKLEGNTKSSKKKYGLSGKAQIEDLIEGKDYRVLPQVNDTIVYYPLTFKASEVLAKPTTPPLKVTGKWCIAGKNYSPGTRDDHWKRYTEEGRGDFFFIFTPKTKYALYRPEDAGGPGGFTMMRLFNSKDSELNLEDFPKEDGGLDLIKKLFRYPRYIKKQYLAAKADCLDKYGFEYSPDKKTLVSAKEYAHCPVILAEYTIPEEVKVIQDRAFQGCQNLRKVILPPVLTEWGPESFYSADVKQIVFPENFSYPRIPLNTFRSAFFLTDVCYGNKQGVLPDSLKDIGPCAFKNCHYLNNLKFPKGLTTIRDSAFQGCVTFTEVDLSETQLTMLEPLTFSNCRNLTTVKLPMSIFRGINGGIHPNTFIGCESLKDVYFYSDHKDKASQKEMEAIAKSIVSHWLDIPKTVNVHYMV